MGPQVGARFTGIACIYRLPNRLLYCKIALQTSLADIAYQIAYVNAYQRHRFALADIAYQIAQASPTTIAYFAAGKWAGQHACTKTGQTYDQHGLVAFSSMTGGINFQFSGFQASSGDVQCSMIEHRVIGARSLRDARSNIGVYVTTRSLVIYCFGPTDRKTP